MKCSVIGIDLAKNVFQICALDEKRQVLFNKKVKRTQLLQELAQFEPTLVVTEACYSSNPWGRRIQALGHTVKCVPAFMVKPFVVGGKNDRNDALAIAEAALRPKIRFVEIKSVEQQDIQSLFQIRQLLIRQKNALSNQLRGLLAEYGEVMPKGYVHLRKLLPDVLENPNNELSNISREFFHQINDNILAISNQIKEIETKIESLIQNKPSHQRISQIPGVGPIISSAIHAFVNDASAFKNGRQFSAWIGLTPKQYASGETNRLGHITKRGNSALRRLLIQGSHILIIHCEKTDTPFNLWLRQLKQRMPRGKCVVAVANKLARVIWHILAHDEAFSQEKVCY